MMVLFLPICYFVYKYEHTFYDYHPPENLCILYLHDVYQHSSLDYQTVCLGAAVPASHFWYSSAGSTRAQESCLSECFHVIRLE